MKILFIHQNMPGQFVHMARHYAADPANEVVFITRRADADMPGVRRVTYPAPRAARRETHHYMRRLENGILHGQQATRAMLALRDKGFRPDIVVAHPGWGESLFVRDVFGAVPVLHYCEFYYQSTGADVNFDPADQLSFDDTCRLRIRNAHLLFGLETCDVGLSPTQWQKSRHPAIFHDKIEVVFDGIDTGIVRPDSSAVYTLPSGRKLSIAHEVVTYVARNLEPYRGYPNFIRAIPEILRRRPSAEIVVVGGDEVSYGSPPKGGGTWRETMAKEVPLDPARVHFTGKIPYLSYVKLLQISAAHVYLTVPFVLSWSMMEAMGAGCLVVGSSTAPVQEVVVEGETGLLVDFFDPKAIAERTVEALERRAELQPVRQRARALVAEHYALDRCLPRQLAVIDRLLGREVSAAAG